MKKKKSKIESLEIKTRHWINSCFSCLLSIPHFYFF